MGINIDINSRAFWQTYVATAQFDAGNYLGAQANAILVQEARQNHLIHPLFRPIIINYTAPRWNLDFSSRVVAALPSGSKTQEERDQERADWAKVVGSVIAVAGAFIVALVYQNYADQDAALSNTQAVNGEVTAWKDHADVTHRDIYQLTQHLLKIDHLNAARINKYTLAAIGVLAGGILMAVGGFAVATALITAGEIVLLASAIFAAGTLGWHWNDDKILRRHYEAIAGRAGPNPQLGLADKILTALPALDENMNAVPDYAQPPKFVPMFPDLYAPDAGAPPPYAYSGAAAPSVPEVHA